MPSWFTPGQPHLSSNIKPSTVDSCMPFLHSSTWDPMSKYNLTDGPLWHNNNGPLALPSMSWYNNLLCLEWKGKDNLTSCTSRKNLHSKSHNWVFWRVKLTLVGSRDSVVFNSKVGIYTIPIHRTCPLSVCNVHPKTHNLEKENALWSLNTLMDATTTTLKSPTTTQ